MNIKRFMGGVGIALLFAACASLPQIPPITVVCPSPAPPSAPPNPPEEPSPDPGPVPTPDPGPVPSPSPTPDPGPVPTPDPGPVPTPTPPPASPAPACQIPSSCPVLGRIGAGVHAQMNRLFQAVPKDPVLVDHKVTFDSTPRFGGGRGLPCNDEHHIACSGDGTDNGTDCWRRCEDPRGQTWEVIEGNVVLKISPDGYQAQTDWLSPGRKVIRVCPRSDAQDAQGKPLQVSGNPCATITIDPR